MGDAHRRQTFGSVIPPGLLPPGVAVTLAGDVNGPSNVNHVDTLTGPGTGIVTLPLTTKISSSSAGVGDIVTASAGLLQFGSGTPLIILGMTTRGFLVSNALGIAAIRAASGETTTIGTSAVDNFIYTHGTTNWNLQILNSAADPATPTGGPKLYAIGGAAKAIGTSGTITTYAAAEPHCPVCDRDFTTEHENREKGYGYLAICLHCLADHVEKTAGPQAWIRREKA